MVFHIVNLHAVKKYVYRFASHINLLAALRPSTSFVHLTKLFLNEHQPTCCEGPKAHLFQGWNKTESNGKPFPELVGG